METKELKESLDWLKRMADRWTMHQNDYYNEKTEEAYEILLEFIKYEEGTIDADSEI